MCFLMILSGSTQLTVTCSKLTIETLEKGVEYVLVLLLLALNIFYPFF